jgi:hypothetical protein
MEREMQTVGLRLNEGLACIKCGRHAAFLSPLGALCPTDALMAATIHGWIPTQIGRRGGNGEEPYEDGD